MPNSIQQVSLNSTALNAEHYQSFEMAKANDGIIGGDDIAQIRSYAAFARAQAQAVHKSIASMSELEDVTATKAEMTETAQTFAKVSVYADERIGEILRELPKSNKWASNSDTQEVETKADAIKESGISKSQAYDLQAMAANPEVVEAVIAKAEHDGRVVSRSQVLKAIKERDEAREKLDSTQREVKASHALGERMKAELDGTKEDLAEAMQAQEDAEAEVTMLKRKLESIEHPEPEVIEREVVREVVPEDVQKRISDLEHLERLHCEDEQKLRRNLEKTRKELDRAKGILGMDSSTRNVQRDVEYLITATNQYVRNYGGLTWTFERIAEVDEITRNELRKAVKNLATFSSALMAGLEQM